MAILGQLRSFLFYVPMAARLAIIFVAFLVMASAASAPKDVSHEVEGLVAASHHQPTGTCHQSSHQCPVALEVARSWVLSMVLMRQDRLRPGGDPAPDEFLKPFDTPPPRI